MPVGYPGATAPNGFACDDAVCGAKMKMPMHEGIDLREQRRDTLGEISYPQNIFGKPDAADKPAWSELIDGAHRGDVRIKPIFEAYQMAANVFIRARLEGGISEAVPVQDADTLAVGPLPIETPAIGLERHIVRGPVVIALDIHDLPTFRSKARDERGKPRHKLDVEPARQTAVAIDHVAIEDDKLRVVDGFGQSIEEPLVLTSADRPTEVDVREQERVADAHSIHLAHPRPERANLFVVQALGEELSRSASRSSPSGCSASQDPRASARSAGGAVKRSRMVFMVEWFVER